MSPEFHAAATFTELGLAAVTLLALLFITAPYGRHTRAGFGPQIASRLGWMIMESPAVLVFGAIFFFGPHHTELVPLVFLAMWWFHYINRAFVFPFRLPANAKPMPVLVCALAIAFNVLNAVVNAGWLGHIGHYDSAWLLDPRFLGGAVLFFVGFTINHRADMRLLALRKTPGSGYQIPHGGLHEWVSSPNYLGEMLEWFGWALATWSLSGLAFALYTVANLAPRALQHHRWYHEKFSDYPKERRALLPFLL